MTVIITGLTLIIFAADMLFKQHIEESVSSDEEKVLIPEKLLIRKVYNKGFILHLLEQKPAFIKIVTAVMTAVILCMNGVLLMKKGHWVKKAGMALVTAGAASNTFDRLVRGKVIDYLGFCSKNKFLSRLTINLADVFIIMGTLILSIIHIIKNGRSS